MVYICGCDFETDHYIDDDGSKVAYIVQYALHDSYGRSICSMGHDDFCSLVLSLLQDLPRNPSTKRKERDIHMYFHNAQYDTSFIYDFLRELPEITGGRATLIAPRKHFISYTLIPSKAKDNPYKNKLRIWDSLKKVPMDLESVGKLLHLPKLDSVADGFKQGWSLRTDFSDPENWRYVKRDAEICCKAMMLFEKSMPKATAAGCAYAEAKKLCGSAYKTGRRYKRDLIWENHMPELPYKVDRELRQAYFGGINFSDPGHYEHCYHLDINSMYPSCMIDCTLPHGKVIKCRPDQLSKGEIFIKKVSVAFTLKENGIPWFKFKHAIDRVTEGLQPDEYVTNTRFYHVLYLTSTDLESLQRHYDLSFEDGFIEECWRFSWSKKGFFKPYVDKWIRIKQDAGKKGDKVTRQVAKIMLNSLYGRTALAPTLSDFSIEETNGWFDMTETVMDPEDIEKYEHDAYLPCGAFITAAARNKLLLLGEKIRELGGHLIHADTDSWIFNGVTPAELAAAGVKIGDGLGEWGIEAEDVEVFEGGVKRYIEYLTPNPKSLDDVNVSCAGVPQKQIQGCPKGMWLELLSEPERIYGHFLLGHERYECKGWVKDLLESYGLSPIQNTMKLMQKKVKGGIVLEETTFDPRDSGYRLRFVRRLF